MGDNTFMIESELNIGSGGRDIVERDSRPRAGVTQPGNSNCCEGNVRGKEGEGGRFGGQPDFREG